MKKDFREGYRVTRTSDGLVIEVLDYHAGPLRLTRADLAELGLRMTASDVPGQQLEHPANANSARPTPSSS